MLLDKIHFKYKGIDRLKIRVQKKHIPCKDKSKENWKSYINIKVDLREQKIKWRKEGH